MSMWFGVVFFSFSFFYTTWCLRYFCAYSKKFYFLENLDYTNATKLIQKSKFEKYYPSIDYYALVDNGNLLITLKSLLYWLYSSEFPSFTQFTNLSPNFDNFLYKGCYLRNTLLRYLIVTSVVSNLFSKHLSLKLHMSDYSLYIHFFEVIIFYNFVYSLRLDPFFQHRLYRLSFIKNSLDCLLENFNKFTEGLSGVLQLKFFSQKLTLQIPLIKICLKFYRLLVIFGQAVIFFDYSQKTFFNEDFFYINKKLTTHFINSFSIDKYKFLIKVPQQLSLFSKLAKQCLVFVVVPKQIHTVFYELYTKPSAYSFRVFLKKYKYQFIKYSSHNTRSSASSHLSVQLAYWSSKLPIFFCKHLYKQVENIFYLKLFNNFVGNEAYRLYSVLRSVIIYNPLQALIRIFIPFFIDFRGRLYPLITFSLANFKLLRTIVSTPINYVFSHRFDKSFSKNLFTESFYNCIDMLKFISCEFSLSLKEKLIVLIGFFSLGKICKSFLIKEGRVSISQFIDLGLIFHTKTITSIIEEYSVTNLEDIALLTTLKFKIQQYLLYKKPFTIVVDSTASGFFHLNSWLTLKMQYLTYINLPQTMFDGYWYDTYIFLYSKVKARMPQIGSTGCEHLFTRTRLKSIFMTIPYGAKYQTLARYFYKGMSVSEKNLAKSVFFDFLTHIQYVLNDIFQLSLYDFVTHPKFKNDFIFSMGGCVYDFRYFKKIDKFTELEYIKNRFSFKTTILTDTLNLKKTETAFCANVIHATDALFLKKIYARCLQMGITAYTIHDEFIIPIDFYFLFILIANQSYQEIYEELNINNIVIQSPLIVL